MKNEETLLRDLDNLGINEEIKFKLHSLKDEDKGRYDIKEPYKEETEYAWCLDYNDKHNNTLISVDILYGHSTNSTSVYVFNNTSFENSDKVFEIVILFRDGSEITLGRSQKDELVLSILRKGGISKTYRKCINERSYRIIEPFYSESNVLSASFFKALSKLRKADKKIDKELNDILL